MGFFTVSRQLSPRQAVSPITLPGITLPGFASRHGAERFHIRTSATLFVSPEARFRGISRALLGALEARAIQRGNVSCSLFSTETAHRFYQTGGYVDAGSPAGKYGMASGYPMFKNLTVSAS